MGWCWSTGIKSCADKDACDSLQILQKLRAIFKAQVRRLMLVRVGCNRTILHVQNNVFIMRHNISQA